MLVLAPSGASAQCFREFDATQDITFGVLATGDASSGFVILDPATGGITTSGGITHFGGTIAPAQFTGRGKHAKGCIVSLTFPASVTVTGAGGTATLSHFTTSPESVTLQTHQRFVFRVGARLTVPAGSPAGTYAGTLTVTAVFTNC